MFIILLFIFGISWSSLRADLSCLDENGNALDWYALKLFKIFLEFDNFNFIVSFRWLISKVPELKHNIDDKKLKSGSGYYFMQPSDPQWHFSSLKISDDDSAFAKTIAPIYASPTPDDVLFLINTFRKINLL